MRDWSATIEGRIIAKKNSKQIFRNQYTGKPVISTSKAYKSWQGVDAIVAYLDRRFPALETGCWLDRRSWSPPREHERQSNHLSSCTPAPQPDNKAERFALKPLSED